MGKPSSSQISKKSDHSYCSKSSNKMKTTIRMKKNKNNNKKRRNRTKKKIQALFQKLRRDTESSWDYSNSENDVSVNSQTPHNNTVINLDTPEQPSRKRKSNSLLANETKKARRKSDCSLIIINDDELVTNEGPCAMTSKRSNTHIDCSTPIKKETSKPIQDLIIDNFSNPKTNNNLSSVHNFNEDVINLTKEINRDSYLTIDLTTTELHSTNTQNTVIDVDNDSHAVEPDCTLVSVSNASLSMSGDSDVTVLEKNKQTNKKEIKKFASGIAKLNASEKGKLLEYIAQKIFNGCDVPPKIKNSLTSLRQSRSRGTETVEDTFIREVILGEAPSRNSVGSNIYRPSRDPGNRVGLRMIVIDGSNVAMEHTKGRIFSVKGLQICIDYFVRRGHVVRAFVPRFRCKFGKSSEPRLLDSLERRGLVVYTPSREIQGKNVVSYDDRYIVQCAAEFDGIIVSGDNYRDLMLENPRWKFVIENRLLPFTWVDDMIMFPRDPLGRNGPTLEQFLKHPEQKVPSIVL